VIVIFAAGITPPERSATVPEIVPNP